MPSGKNRVRSEGWRRKRRFQSLDENVAAVRIKKDIVWRVSCCPENWVFRRKYNIFTLMPSEKPPKKSVSQHHQTISGLLPSRSQSGQHLIFPLRRHAKSRRCQQSIRQNLSIISHRNKKAILFQNGFFIMLRLTRN